jgi:hypothetical protein
VQLQSRASMMAFVVRKGRIPSTPPSLP